MPPSASPRPGVVATAPVKRRARPKSSDSRAPAAAPRRSPRRTALRVAGCSAWMSRATTSLPLPVSPRMTALDEVRATTAAFARRAWSGGLSEITREHRRSPSHRPPRAGIRRRGAERSIASSRPLHGEPAAAAASCVPMKHGARLRPRKCACCARSEACSSQGSHDGHRDAPGLQDPRGRVLPDRAPAPAPWPRVPEPDRRPLGGAPRADDPLLGDGAVRPTALLRKAARRHLGLPIGMGALRRRGSAWTAEVDRRFGRSRRPREAPGGPRGWRCVYPPRSRLTSPWMRVRGRSSHPVVRVGDVQSPRPHRFVSRRAGKDDETAPRGTLSRPK